MKKQPKLKEDLFFGGRVYVYVTMGLLVGRGWENSQEHSRPFLFPELLPYLRSPRPNHLAKWMFQLDDEPNLCRENWLEITISIHL